MMMRFLGIAIALIAHLLLGVTVWFLFPFLMGRQALPAEEPSAVWWLCDILLIVQFGLAHSLLLAPGVRRRLECLVSRPLYGCCFTLVTCSSLLLLILAWQRSPVVIWHLSGSAKMAIQAGYLSSWAGLFYAIGLTGYGLQTGWTSFRAWVRGEAQPRRVFTARGAYRWLRHPVYLCFLGLVWFTPSMTLDRTLLTGLMTAYIFLGSYLKDRRLTFYLGDVYREYQARVRGYPFIGFGPLGRVSQSPTPSGRPAAIQSIGQGEVLAPLGGSVETGRSRNYNSAEINTSIR